MDLDELLAASAPQVAVRTPELQRDLDAAIVAAESAARPRRRRARLLISGLACAAVVGGAGTAAAAAGLLGFGWTSDDGNACQVGDFEVQLASPRLSDSKAGFDSTTAAEREATVEAARQFLAEYDWASIDVDEAVRQWQRVEDRAIAAQPDPEERQERLVGDDLETTAVGHLVHTEVRQHLTELGHDPDVLLGSFTTNVRVEDGVPQCGR